MIKDNIRLYLNHILTTYHNHGKINKMVIFYQNIIISDSIFQSSNRQSTLFGILDGLKVNIIYILLTLGSWDRLAIKKPTQ